ncbi:PatA/PatG family cyanobactin maturation protease [Kamptonema formosum]|uniref:PatA/PatG family cyanobactin maturation protease n=1 Tax=Kamptonema formosum TaxID=331992 RepID=UPI00035E4C33|nr:PatA/PatG family cyanobactin maturation protease [Oscillatoria sp. PCC 10802]
MPDIPGNFQYQQRIRNHYDIFGESPTNQGCLLRMTDSDADPVHATIVYLIAQAGIKPGDYVLDAGCGTGGPSVAIAQSVEGVRVEGINLSEGQVSKAQQLVREAGLADRVRIQLGDYHDLPFEDNIFDVVVFFDTASYSDNFPQLFAEIYRVLRPQGTLYIKDGFPKEGPLSPEEELKLLQIKQISLTKLPRLSEMREAIERAGFQDIQCRDLSEIFTVVSFPDDPVFCGEIKARKPAVTPTAIRHIRSSSSELSAEQSSSATGPSAPVAAGGVTASAQSTLVYTLGTLGYDFGTEARRDSFKQLMPGVSVDGTMVPANPYDARQMVDYLNDNLSEAKSLIWTLNLELTPVYAIEPMGSFGRDVYAVLRELLSGQIQPEDNEEYVERVSIPGILSGRTVKLFSGQVVPVIDVPNTRGLYGWKVNTLVGAAVETVRARTGEANQEAIERTLSSFLNRIYYDLRNLGTTSQDRALNFAATNAFQAASTFAEAVGAGMELDSITVEKSPFCRLDSDCWDVKLKFFDPENSRRARKVFRFTIDVSDLIPVTLGEVRSWSTPY